MYPNKRLVTLITLIGLMGGTLSAAELNGERSVVAVDKCVKNLERERKEADSARKAWKGRSEERQTAEMKYLEKLNIPDLSKKAVSILVKAENPQYIVNKAVETARQKGLTIVIPPWGKGTKPEDNKFWSIVYREKPDANHDWWIERNNVFGQYRLVGNPNQHLYFSINNEEKLRTVLVYIVIFGDTKPFYWVAEDSDYVDYCEVLSPSEATKIFPETTIRLVKGAYAKHPCNPYALVPIADFHARLAMDKATECVVLLGRMGAKSVRISRMDGKKHDAEGEVKISVMGSKANVNTALANEMTSRMDLRVVFSGDLDVDIPPTLLENSVWHKSDKILNGIFEARRSGNKIKEFTIIEEDQSDYNFDFKAAASILGVTEVDLRTKFENMKQAQRTFQVAF